MGASMGLTWFIGAMRLERTFVILGIIKLCKQLHFGQNL